MLTAVVENCEDFDLARLSVFSILRGRRAEVLTSGLSLSSELHRELLTPQPGGGKLTIVTSYEAKMIDAIGDWRRSEAVGSMNRLGISGLK